MRTSSQGFATVVLLSLLPLVLAGGMALFCVFGFLKSDLATLNLCRTKQMEVQNRVGRNLTKLLALNPRALKLRISEARAQKALLAAMESGAPPAIAAAEAYLLSVQMRRQALHLRQRALIETANTWLTAGGENLQQELRQEWWRHTNGLSSWLQNTLQLNSADVPELAVHPDLPETAPLYELNAGFNDAQAWKQSWSFRLKTTAWAAKFLKFNGGFERSCTTSLYAEGETWNARMKKDKSLLKGFL